MILLRFVSLQPCLDNPNDGLLNIYAAKRQYFAQNTLDKAAVLKLLLELGVA
ncbi:hypothetical protein D3C85_1778190 [compost metagenome]